MNIDTYFDKIFVINLDESIDRWKDVVEELEKANIKNYERVPGIRLKNLDDVPEKHYQNLVSANKIHDYYKLGICGANKAHVRCVELAKERKYDNVLILEDDIGIRDDVNELFEKVSNQLIAIEQQTTVGWDMLYLGSSIREGAHVLPIAKNVVKGNNLLSCHAYAVKNTLYDKILDEGILYGAELDNFYLSRIQPYFNCVVVKPKLIWQKSGESITSQVYNDFEGATRE